MSDQTIPEEPAGANETFEQWDEARDAAEDPGATGVSGAEDDLTRATDLPVDEEANDEIGAGLDDPERLAMLDGGMDDPDGIDPREADDPDDPR